MATGTANCRCTSFVELLYGTSLPSRFALSSTATRDYPSQEFKEEGLFILSCIQLMFEMLLEMFVNFVTL